MFPYKLTLKKDTLKTKKHFYYATAIKQGALEEEELLAQLSKRTKLHPVDCQRFLYHLAELMGDSLLEGNTVILPQLGTFRATLGSKGVEDPRDFKKTDIRGMKIAFLPHKIMKSRMKGAQFKLVKP